MLQNLKTYSKDTKSDNRCVLLSEVGERAVENRELSRSKFLNFVLKKEHLLPIIIGEVEYVNCRGVNVWSLLTIVLQDTNREAHV